MSVCTYVKTGAEPYSMRESMYALHGLKHVCTKSLSFLLGILTACFIRTSQHPSSEASHSSAGRGCDRICKSIQAEELAEYQAEQRYQGPRPSGESDFAVSGTGHRVRDGKKQ